MDIPFSTIFMFLLAAGIALLTSLVNRLLTDPKKSNVWKKEISEWNKELRDAQRGDDKKQLEKVMKKQQYIFQLQSKMMWQSMKVMLIFLVPLLLIWQYVGAFIGTNPIAYFPGLGPNLPLPFFGSSLLWWYLICSLLFGTIFSHLFGLVEVSD